jgi:hypothetical protein
MTKTKAFALITLIVAFSTASLAEKKSTQECSAIFKANGVSERFPAAVAHGIHSITVADLRDLNAHVTLDNGIPTVNFNLSSPYLVLPNAQDVASHFSTTGMRTADQVLSHMDDKNYDVKGYTTLERLVHALHMQECWHHASMHYHRFLHHPPSKQLCSCATDIEHNGVKQAITNVAMQIRDPSKFFRNGKYEYTYRFFVPDDELLSDQHRPLIPPLNDEVAWMAWKQIMSNMKPSDEYELGLYLYCALNK